ncbi:MAG: Wzt carbohydrate-binding domain-containing protein, partial [Candidatus Taylorbacteria bacterium]|nr:Wzt carbohydrate-binding domain-containing protein [Candidatus Taylorbacteria bacterium]
GVDKFLDTPVKFYSSGMYVRLAFSVAAHMEPDILLVDEVLAVGDAEFQKKCLGKMDEITKKDGRTIIFVSHNMGAIQQLCTKTAVLSNGKIELFDDTDKAIHFYIDKLPSLMNGGNISTRKRRGGVQNTKVTQVAFYDKDGNKIDRAVTGKPLKIRFTYSSKKPTPIENCRVAVSFKNMLGQDLFICSTELTEKNAVHLPPSGDITCEIEALPLGKGRYTLDFMFEVDRQVEDRLEDAATLQVENGDFYGTAVTTPPNWEGRAVLVKHHWFLK